MENLKSKLIPLLEEGSERELMSRVLFGVKRVKGLTTALVQTAGVNSRWLKPEEPHDIPSKRLLRIVIHSMHFLGRDRCKQKANDLIDYVFDHIIPVYAAYLAGKRKQ